MPGIDTLIRPATPADAAAVRECVVEAYLPYVDRIGKPPAPMLDDYSELIERGVVHVAVRSGRVVGSIALWPKHDHLYIDSVATAADVRRTGVGSALLEWADELARRSGHAEIRLYTNVAMVENLEYYPRKGFVETHRSSEGGYDRVYYSRSVSFGTDEP